MKQADNDLETVYFLNQVDEADLPKLMDEDDDADGSVDEDDNEPV